MSINAARLEISSNAAFANRRWPAIALDALKQTVPPRDGFEILESVGSRISIGRNEKVFEEGDDAKHCYRLVSGSVRLCKFLIDGRRQIAEFFLPGDFFGFIDATAYAFSAEAVSDVVVMRYTRARVEMLSDGDICLRRHLNWLLHERLSAAQQHLVALGRHTVRERVASFLIQMADRLGMECGANTEIDLPMGRLDIADYLGLTIETVCRAISELKRAGVIAVPNTHRIVLRDARRLRDLIEGKALLSA